MTEQDTDTQRIAELNDLARTAMGLCSVVMQTPGIFTFSLEGQSRIRELVETYSDFNPDNDLCGERDFGAFSFNNEKIF